MPIKSFEDLKNALIQKQNKYDSCEHDFDDEATCYRAVGRFGGLCVSVYRCKNCGLESPKKDELEAVMSHYDDRGMPIE